MEHKLSQCIIYNLNILRKIVPCSEQMEEHLVEGLFIKSNTSAFIHVMHYLFNVVDSKEFKKRFYWPIIDKRSENSFRSNSVEFFNFIIDKHNIPQDKVKQVVVVHPSGKKFMGLVLEVIKIAQKEVLQRKFKATKAETSLNLPAALEYAKNLHKAEKDLNQIVNEELKVIRERTQAIQNIISSVDQLRLKKFDNCADYEEFIKMWHSFLRDRSEGVKKKAAEINEIVIRTQKLFEKTKSLMQNVKFDETGSENSVTTLINRLGKCLPVIKNYLENYPLQESSISENEIKMLKKKIADLSQLDQSVKSSQDKMRSFQESTVRLKNMHDASQLLGNESQYEIIPACLEDWKIDCFNLPTPIFDIARSCMNHADYKNSRFLSLIYDSSAPSMLHNSLLDSTRIFKVPHIQQPQPIPSRRKRQNAMEMLDRALSSSSQNKNKSVMDRSIILGPGHCASTPLSSTMIVPNNLRKNFELNSSTISNISMLSRISPTLREEEETIIEMKTAVAMDDITNTLPKITVNDVSLHFESTLCEKENFGDSIQKPFNDDEDLFNISDSCLTTDF